MIVTDAYRRNYAEITWSPLPPSVPRERPANAAPHVITDIMDGTWHPVTGRVVDSKSEFRKMTRAAGCEEVGTSKWPERVPAEPPKPGMDIKRAIEELRGR